MKIILASASERRQELLTKLVDDFSVIVSDFDESSIEFQGDYSNYVIQLSRGKAYAAAQKIKDDAVIIACDTIVALDGVVLGKPKDGEEAIAMLKKLSGRTHEVFSGLTVLNTNNSQLVSDYAKTEVTFSKLTQEEMERYVHTGEPMDKAGAYGIQGYGGVFVEKINGCYYNVVGLPINKLKNILKGIGVNL
ncbi:MAG: Maf-like protein [Clostridiales bacterium]|uniref:Maf-like protein n=1 Tax=Clostridium sp. N3C TaxID=1776758 RepID=UPI00092E0A0B|nr:Maf-like protein [Clostridium sp. N3C]NLZ48514.1 Maf-like protein [Clostridiales bacterium]SCN21718.1 Septum formation protein Maf [Clostridium sp. N3C]